MENFLGLLKQEIYYDTTYHSDAWDDIGYLIASWKNTNHIDFRNSRI